LLTKMLLPQKGFKNEVCPLLLLFAKVKCCILFGFFTFHLL
jgi:hypothetical protein